MKDTGDLRTGSRFIADREFVCTFTPDVESA